MKLAFDVVLKSPGKPTRFSVCEVLSDDGRPKLQGTPSLSVAIERMLATGIADQVGRFEVVITVREVRGIPLQR